MENSTLENVCMQLITYAGIAKSSYIEAMAERRSGNKNSANKLLKEGQTAYNECHKIHQKMFGEQYEIEDSLQNVLLMHAEDQMMACETIYILASELMKCYERIENLENKR